MSVSDTNFILKSKTRKHLENLKQKINFHFIGSLFLYFIQFGQ